MDNNLINRITISPDVCFGKPTIRNTRYSIDLILDLLSSGMSYDEVIDDYPAIQKDDILACISYASKLSKFKIVQNVAV